MTRRNLRKWAEAKQRRVQQAPPRGRWSYAGTPIFFEDPPFGTYVAPTAWLPMEPAPTDGQPYMRALNSPRTEPSMTIVRQVRAEALARAYDTVGRLLLYGVELHPLVLDHGIDRTVVEKRLR